GSISSKAPKRIAARKAAGTIWAAVNFTSRRRPRTLLVSPLHKSVWSIDQGSGFLCLHQGRDDIDGKRKNDRGIFLGTHLNQGLKVPELQSGGIAENCRGFGQLLRSLEFALCMDDLSPPLPFGFRLL